MLKPRGFNIQKLWLRPQHSRMFFVYAEVLEIDSVGDDFDVPPAPFPHLVGEIWGEREHYVRGAVRAGGDPFVERGQA